MKGNHKLKEKKLLIFMFVVFLFLRLFVSYNSVLLGSDNLKFMEVSKRFPYHTLTNDQLYLHHAPIYPYMVHFFALIFKDEFIAGIFLSLVAASVTFYVFYKFLMMLSKNFSVTFISLILFTLSVDFIITSNSVLRESFIVMLLSLSMYYYAKGIKFEDKKSILLAAFWGAITALSTDHVMFLFPAFGVTYLFLNKQKTDLIKFKFPNLKWAIMPVIVTLLFFALWLGVKVHQYSKYEFYPSGFEGTPISTKGFGLAQLIDPHNFKDYTTQGGLGVDLKRIVYNFGYVFNIEPFEIPRGLNFLTYKYLLMPIHVFYIFLIYVPIAILSFLGIIFGIKESIKIKKFHQNVYVYFFVLLLIFISPVFYQANSPRYIYPAYLFLYFFIASGLIWLLTKLNVNINKAIMILTVLLILLVPFWYFAHKNFVFFSEKTIGAANTAKFINENISKDAVIMSQPGFTFKLIYQTNNRIIGLYPKPEALLNVMNYYNVSYIVVGRYYTYDVYHLAKDSVEFVNNNPKKFKLIATIKEDYSDFFKPEDPASRDEGYIYQVLR